MEGLGCENPLLATGGLAPQFVTRAADAVDLFERSGLLQSVRRQRQPLYLPPGPSLRGVPHGATSACAWQPKSHPAKAAGFLRVRGPKCRIPSTSWLPSLKANRGRNSQIRLCV